MGDSRARRAGGSGRFCANGSIPIDAATGADIVAERLMDDYHLTAREAQVAIYIAQGYSIGHVAESLRISKGTAQSYVRNAYRKLEIHTKDELIAFIGMQWGQRPRHHDKRHPESVRIAH